MAGTTSTDLNGLFKQVYGDDIINLVPEFAHIIKNTKFVKNDQRSGDYYNQPVVVQDEQGVTYASAGAGAFSLNPEITLVMKNAQLLGGQIAFKASMDIESAKRAVAGGASAFASATKLQVANVLKSHTKRAEINAIYGQTSVAQVDTGTGLTATTMTLTLTDGSWAPGIWAGSTGAKISLFSTSGGTNLNTNAALVVTAIDVVNKKLTVSGNSTDISAIIASVTATDALVSFYGARTGSTGATYNEAAGLDKILTNTSSLFGIDASAYSLWAGNTYNVSGALTQAHVNAAVAIATSFGLAEDVTLFVSPKTWGKLETDQAGLRQYDTSYSTAKAENGSKSITFYSQNGKIEVVSHPFVKESEGFLVPLSEVIRTGATEITFNIPGQQGEYFTPMENSMGFFFKSYSNQALLFQKPATGVKLYGITNA